MIRIVLLFVLIGVAVWSAVWFADHPGRVEIEAMGYRVETTVGVLIVAIVVLSIAVAVLYRAWRSLRRAPRRLVEHRGTSRRQRGYQALTQGMVAVAAGDSREAMRFARKADSLLKEPPLTMLLSAQAAQLDGNEDAARGYFEAMLAEPDMAFLGVRGLLMQAVRRDDNQEALRLAGKAQTLRPNTPWVLKHLLDLQVDARQWDAADQTLRQAVKVGVVDAQAGRRRRAALAVEASWEASARGDNAAATKRARAAYDLDPGLVPASVAFVKCLSESGKTRRAVKTLEAVWGRAPHPDLAAVYATLAGEDEVPLNRVKRFQCLATFHPDHPESHFALAEASFAAQLWGEARRHLDSVPAEQRSARFFRLMADLEEQEAGDYKAARRWLDEAASAAPEQAWYCSDCGSVADAWQACCPTCGAFAALDWRLPPGTAALDGAPLLTLPETAA
ncbi:MAG: tetratricopeptide repeat protein [Alphaproteobacteria bacterium]|nr:tetratricopeptide repeat protein [Alphaproteobacteria bacterium]